MVYKMRIRKRDYYPPSKLKEDYLVSFILMWSISILMIINNIIGYFDIFLPYIIASAVPMMIHLLIYRFFSYRTSLLFRNILTFIMPILVILVMILLVTITSEPKYKEFTIVKTSKFPCGKKSKEPKKYLNHFMSGKHTSKFEVKIDNHLVTWYPNESNYYKYNMGDKIKIKVKENFLGMSIIVQQNRDGE